MLRKLLKTDCREGDELTALHPTAPVPSVYLPSELHVGRLGLANTPHKQLSVLLRGCYTLIASTKAALPPPGQQGSCSSLRNGDYGCEGRQEGHTMNTSEEHRGPTYLECMVYHQRQTLGLLTDLGN